MKVTESDAAMMLAVRKDGTAGTGEPRPCGLCKKPMVEFVTSPGLRRVAPALEERAIVCTNTKWKGPIPCPAALKAKPILDALARL